MTRVTGAILLAGLLAVAVSAQQAPATQTPEPPPVVFRAEVNYVEVDAVVTDAQGNIVRDLSAGDFEVLEDGRTQTIASFSRVDLPIERAERPLFTSAIEPDVYSNQEGEGRIYLIVLDDLHTDPTRTPRVKAAARRFIEQRFGTNDLAAVVYTSGSGPAAQDFTSNRRLLVEAIERFSGRKFRSATMQQLETVRTDLDGNLQAGLDLDAIERSIRARSSMSAIRQMAEYMASIRGRRKALLLVSEGIDYDIHDAINDPSSANRVPVNAAAVLQETNEAVAAATRANVVIYAIDPRGLTTGTEELIESVINPSSPAGMTSSLNSELRLSQDSLRALAANTGGFAAVNQNNFDTAFERIVSENSSYYLFGYYATNERRDGRNRKLEVRVKRPGLQVRSRTGYTEPRGRAAAPPESPPAVTTGGSGPPLPAMVEALRSPLPIADIPMRVFAAPFKGTAPDAAVAIAVELDMSRFDYVNKDGAWAETIEIAHSATTPAGKIIPGERHQVSLAMRPETFEKVKANGFRLLTQTNLPPGRYQMRVAVGNPAGKSGSVIADLEVPDFSSQPLMMSGIALTSVAAQQISTSRPKDPLGDYLPGPFTATREFPADDLITIFGEVYENLRNEAAHRVAIVTELRADDGRVLLTQEDERSSTELQGLNGGYGFTSRLPLSGLDPGIYVIHVQAQAQIGDRPTVSHDIQIRVR